MGTPESAAHEFGHCLNRQHLLNVDCPGGSTAMGSDDPVNLAHNWPDGGEIVPDRALPFDIIGNDTVVGNGDEGVWDLMSYCKTRRWMSSERWRRIFNYLGG